jgi:hypothetical protein
MLNPRKAFNKDDLDKPDSQKLLKGISFFRDLPKEIKKRKRKGGNNTLGM